MARRWWRMNDQKLGATLAAMSTRGTRGNPHAIGAVVELAPAVRRSGESLMPTRSYLRKLSRSSPLDWVPDKVENLPVTWPNGEKQQSCRKEWIARVTIKTKHRIVFHAVKHGQGTTRERQI